MVRRLTKEQVDQFCETGHYIMRGKASNKRGQAIRDWHRLQVERAMYGEPDRSWSMKSMIPQVDPEGVIHVNNHR
jgi:hypothetical protein